MLVRQAARKLVVMAMALAVWASSATAARSSFKLCGRKLSDIMSKVCYFYNSPSWDIPTVVEQPTSEVRRKRQSGGIADECCINGCTWEQLSEYCAVSAPPSILKELHMIEDRSAEKNTPSGILEPTRKERESKTDKQETKSGKREMKNGRRWKRLREVGGKHGLRGWEERRCWCVRRHRSGRRRAALPGNTIGARNVIRAAPVVGTVSPLLMWGRTLNTDLPPADRNRYAYLAVYST